MIGDILHIGRRLSGKPLIYFVLIKSLAFTIWVALFDVVELLIRGYIETHTINGAFHDFLSHINGVLIGGLLVVYCAFVPFFALKELSKKVGQEKFHELFFKKDESL